ncbi:hypothetical protein AWB77_05920 [Caballeronia fortuita]|uniref:Uncharacterized protein n=1 Tax=Caballeronia fortuita TaxID=1777138 RepID=A0A158DXU8_9BURK|nr:hypothetical protein [Caballeronia fortuita]SAK99016.1 hypothetical protein AWB77_05920 [Caballeronia fortuita]
MLNKYICENSQVQIGLVTQGHIPTIECMLEGGALWHDIGRAINWDPATAAQHYARYAFDQLRRLRSELETHGLYDAESAPQR